jgi:3-mercaptopyruvate sulfurtransferase SseA
LSIRESGRRSACCGPASSAPRRATITAAGSSAAAIGEQNLVDVRSPDEFDGSWTEYGSLVGVPIETGD